MRLGLCTIPSTSAACKLRLQARGTTPQLNDKAGAWPKGWRHSNCGQIWAEFGQSWPGFCRHRYFSGVPDVSTEALDDVGGPLSWISVGLGCALGVGGPIRAVGHLGPKSGGWGVAPIVAGLGFLEVGFGRGAVPPAPLNADIRLHGANRRWDRSSSESLLWEVESGHVLGVTHSGPRALFLDPSSVFGPILFMVLGPQTHTGNTCAVRSSFIIVSSQRCFCPAHMPLMLPLTACPGCTLYS